MKRQKIMRGGIYELFYAAKKHLFRFDSAVHCSIIKTTGFRPIALKGDGRGLNPEF